ncbi:MAG: endonuclease/exonuclease/phosphatase family protein [Thermoanaerobaculia bacterium]|nr:endonuclease/exonuclease/phosphatase family protein [Thermoanaerobaculia bacterium]
MVNPLRTAFTLPPLARIQSRLGVWTPRWLSEPQWRRSPLDPLVDADSLGSLRVATLNIAHGRGLAKHQALLAKHQVEDNLHRIAELVGEQDPDLVALQEADGPSVWSGNFHHVETLAQHIDHSHAFLGEHNLFGLGVHNLISGTALISRNGMIQPSSQRFGSSWRDTKGFVVATLPVPAWGFSIDVVSTHFEALHPAVRRRQIRLLAHYLGQRTRPLVVLGDFNASWCRESGQFRPLAQRLGLRTHQPYHKAPTFPSVRPWRRLDWILVSRELEFVRYETLSTPVSDHLAVVADIRPVRLRLPELPELPELSDRSVVLEDRPQDGGLIVTADDLI